MAQTAAYYQNTINDYMNKPQTAANQLIIKAAQNQLNKLNGYNTANPNMDIEKSVNDAYRAAQPVNNPTVSPVQTPVTPIQNLPPVITAPTNQPINQPVNQSPVLPNVNPPPNTGTGGTQNNTPTVQDLVGMIKGLIPAPVAAPQYTSPYGTQITDALAKLSEGIYNKKAYDPNTDAGLAVAQKSAMNVADQNMAARGLLTSQSGKYGQQSAYQAGQQLIPQYQQMYNQQQQQDLQNLSTLLNAYQGQEEQGYNRYRDAVGDVNTQNQNNISNILNILNSASGLQNQQFTQSRSNKLDTISQLNDIGKTINPMTGEVVNTAAQNEKQITEYINSITGLGNQFDYQSEINKISNDGDTSNDWKIPYLKQAREDKIQTNLKNDIAKVSQYSNDYQAEINRRSAIDPNDPLIPYLNIARAEKIASMNESKLASQEKLQKTAYDIWKESGIATPEIAAVLGIPEGFTTAQYKKNIQDANLEQQKINISSSKESRLSSGSGGNGVDNSTFTAMYQQMKSYLDDREKAFKEADKKAIELNKDLGENTQKYSTNTINLLNEKGSAERKVMFDEMIRRMDEANLSDEQQYNILSRLGYTEFF